MSGHQEAERHKEEHEVDSSDSDSGGDVDLNEEDSARIMELESTIQQNPNHYDSHVQVGSRARLGLLCIYLSCHAAPPSRLPP